jgi:hypothetical protein
LVPVPLTGLLVETASNVQDTVSHVFGRILMESLATQRRAERVIRECRTLGIEPSARTVAEIMVDDDVTRDRYDNFSDEWHVALAEYEKAADRALTRGSDPAETVDRRRRA